MAENFTPKLPYIYGWPFSGPCFGPCLELFKTEAVYKSESNKARGISLP